MKTLCTEIGNEIYLVHKNDEIINFYEKDGNNLHIYPVISIIGSFYKNYQNTNVSIYDLLQIIINDNDDKNSSSSSNENNNSQDINVMDEREIHKLFYNVFLPKFSKKRSLPLL